MKVVLFQFNNPFNRKILSEIFRQTDTREVYNFWPLHLSYPDKSIFPSSMIIHEKAEDWFSILSGNNELLDFESQIPVDEELVLKMAPVEHMCKRIILRHYKNFPAIFRNKLTGIARIIDTINLHMGSKDNALCPSYYELHSTYLRFIRYWSDFFSKNQISMLLSEFIPHSGMDYIGYEVAKIYNIPIVCGYFTPGTAFQFFTGDHQNIAPGLSDLISEIKQRGNLNEGSLQDKSKIELKRIRNSFREIETPWTGDFKKMNDFEQSLKKNEKENLLALYKDYPYMVEKTNFSKFLSQKISGLILKTPWAKKNKYENRIVRIYEQSCIVPDLTKKYIYLPLHRQPELSSQPLGGLYEYQLLIAQMLNYHIPDDWLIYVKEHNKPGDYNNRPPEFYEELLKLKKVRLISTKMQSLELIEYCLATAAVTGTAGYEGLFRNKPFLMFGNQITEYAPGVFRISTNEDCKHAIDCIKKGVTIEEQDIIAFLIALEAITIPTTISRYSYIQNEFPLEEWESIIINGYVNRIKSVIKT